MFAAPPAAAQDRAAREREARQACFTGDWTRGIEILVDLYVETRHPTYIFNQARCFERNGRDDQALYAFEDYLQRAKDVEPAERAEIEASLARLKSRIAARAPAQIPSPPVTTQVDPLQGPRAPPVDAAPVPGPDAASTRPSRASRRPPPDARRAAPEPAAWSTQKLAGAGFLAGGGAMLTLGVVGTVLRESRASSFNERCWLQNGVQGGGDCQSRYDGVQSARSLMIIGYAGMAVLGGVGTFLLLTLPEDAGAARAGLACGPAPVLAGIVCRGRF